MQVSNYKIMQAYNVIKHYYKAFSSIMSFRINLVYESVLNVLLRFQITRLLLKLYGLFLGFIYLSSVYIAEKVGSQNLNLASIIVVWIFNKLNLSYFLLVSYLFLVSMEMQRVAFRRFFLKKEGGVYCLYRG